MVMRPFDTLHQTVRGALVRIGILWLLAIITGVIHQVHVNLLVYYNVWSYYYTSQMFLFLINFIMPISIASVAYYRMYIGLQKPIPGSNANLKQVQDRRK